MKNIIKNKIYYRIDSDIQQIGKYYPQLEYIKCSNYENVNSLINLSPNNLIVDTCSEFKLKYGSKRTDMLTFGGRYFIFSNELKVVFDKCQSTNFIWIPVQVDFSKNKEKLHVFYPKKMNIEDDILDFKRTSFKVLNVELDVVQKDLVLEASNPLNSMNEIRKGLGKFDILKIDKIFIKEKNYETHVIDLYPFESVNSILISSELKNQIEELKLTGIQFHGQEVYLTI